MVEPDAVSVGRISHPELATLVQDVTRTVSYVLRPFGVNFPPATEEEANNIAIPGARMLNKWPKIHKTIRRISDPVVLVGATVALFSVRRMLTNRATAPPAPPAPNIARPVTNGNGKPAAAPASDARVTQTSAMPAPPLRRAADVYERDLREDILDGIAGAGIVS